MKKYAFALTGGLLLFVSLGAQPEDPREIFPLTLSGRISSHEVLQEFCVRCHGDLIQQKDLSFATFDVDAAGENAEVAERMTREAGFTRFRMHDFEDPANLYYELQP